MNENEDVKTVVMDVWGPYAIFTRPEFRSERFTYDVITPSSARNILQSIYWHPTFDYVIKSIQIMTPIQRCSHTINELSSICSGKTVAAYMRSAALGETVPALGVMRSEPRQQRTYTFLRDVYYRIEAEIRLKPDIPEDERHHYMMKIHGIVTRRIERGQCFRTPYLGIRECRADFAPPSWKESKNYSPYHGAIMDLGPMLFDMDYTTIPPTPYFYHPIIRDGKIDVPDPKEVMKHGA